MRQYFKEKQIYRIDHYLGKEAVQNLMALRFANSFFEPLWNSKYISQVQITVAESLGVEGRGDYYDKSGASRDMLQNHMMQLLSLIAMEMPYKIDANAIRDEKVKVIKSLKEVKKNDIVIGQYTNYKKDIQNINSTSESYIALKTYINNWRWQGTPFYLRTGKKLKTRMSEIVLIFKNKSSLLFKEQKNLNRLRIKIQPNESISMTTFIKDPSSNKIDKLKEVPIDMFLSDFLKNKNIQDAYERLIIDVVKNDQTLFMREDELFFAWEWCDKIINKIKNIKPDIYEEGSDGPKNASKLLEKLGHFWSEIK